MAPGAPTFRIAVVSDIHGNLPALEAVLDQMAGERVDLVVNCGDIVSGPLWPRETAARLMALGWPTIAGNHERQALAAAPGTGSDDAFAAAELGTAERAWLAALPATLTLAGGAVTVVHGTPASDLHTLLETVVPGFGTNGFAGIRAASEDEVRARLQGVATPVVLCGHTHVARVVRVDGCLVVNPGSLGRPAYEHDQPHDHVVEAGTPHASWALVERGPRGWQAQLRLTAYDWGAAAARAESLGRGDWADALATGRVGRRQA
jgi:predicted phosphodiesterase